MRKKTAILEMPAVSDGKFSVGANRARELAIEACILLANKSTGLNEHCEPCNCLRFFRIVNLRKNLQSVHQVTVSQSVFISWFLSKFLSEDPIVCNSCKIGLAHLFQGKGLSMYL